MELFNISEGISEYNVIFSRFENGSFPSYINWTHYNGYHINSQSHRKLLLVVYVSVKTENFTVFLKSKEMCLI